eukprot:scaffold81063_cov64-Phaeocystis_antarctica.AAC.2
MIQRGDEKTVWEGVNASTHILQCQNHEHAHSSRSVQGSVQGGDGGKFNECSKVELTKLARLAYTLVSVSVAVP